jgi:hypothetical protein
MPANPHVSVRYQTRNLGTFWAVEQVINEDGHEVPLSIKFPNELAAQHFAEMMNLGVRYAGANLDLREIAGKAETGLHPNASQS